MLLKITPIQPGMSAKKKAAQISLVEVLQLEDILWIGGLWFRVNSGPWVLSQTFWALIPSEDVRDFFGISVV